MSINSINHKALAPQFAAPKPTRSEEAAALAPQGTEASAISAADTAKLDKAHGKNGRPAQALFAALGGPGEGKALRPQPPADQTFAPETLDALIETQTEPDAEEAATTPPPAGQSLADRLVAALDGDGDGAFSLTELRDAMPGKSGYSHGRGVHAEQAFNRIDADGDGQVTGAELATALGAAPPPAEEPAVTDPAPTDTVPTDTAATEPAATETAATEPTETLPVETAPVDTSVDALIAETLAETVEQALVDPLTSEVIDPQPQETSPTV